MKQLELQQEREEQELVARAAANGTAGATNTDSTSVPARSRSGNDLASFSNDGAVVDASERRKDYQNAKSMPGSRRHSGDLKEDGAAPGVVGEGAGRKGRDGEPLLNNFTFDDELDSDLQGKHFCTSIERMPSFWSLGRVSASVDVRSLTYASSAHFLFFLPLECRLSVGRKISPNEHRR